MAPKSHKNLIALAALMASIVSLLAFSPLATAAPAVDDELMLTVKERARIKLLTKHEHKSISTVGFYKSRDRGRWALHPKNEMCWQVHGKQRRKVCRKARRLLAVHTARLHRVSEKLDYFSAELGDLRDWTCLHREERGADGWQTNTGNGYYGGLQMDRDFQQAHGLDLYRAKGMANNWTPREQVMVAQRAKLGIRTSSSDGRVVLWQDNPRGYGPWPNTRKECGI